RYAEPVHEQAEHPRSWQERLLPRGPARRFTREVLEAGPHGERQDRRGEVHPEEPARLEADVDVREREEEAEHAAEDDGAHRELRGPGPVDPRIPLGLVDLEHPLGRYLGRPARVDLLGRRSRTLEQAHGSSIPEGVTALAATSTR